MGVTDSDHSVHHPSFQLHDEYGFLRDGDIDVHVTERQVSFARYASIKMIPEL